MTKKEFKTLYDNMKALFPKDDMVLSNEALKLWYDCLKDLDFRRVDEGLRLYAMESNWIPSIAEIRKYANKVPKYTKEEVHKFIVEAHKKERQNDSFGF